MHEACAILDAVGVPYVIGGGTAVVHWGRNRRTRDFDLFLNREVLGPAMYALSRAGFLATDTEKKWLCKALRGESRIDFIVESRGGVRIDDETLARAVMVEQHGYTFRLMGAEDVIYRKALTLTEGRPDRYDAISIIDHQRERLDWTYLVYRAQRHRRRFLSFLLFSQTELHNPPGIPHNQADNYLYEDATPARCPNGSSSHSWHRSGSTAWPPRIFRARCSMLGAKPPERSERPGSAGVSAPAPKHANTATLNQLREECA